LFAKVRMQEYAIVDKGGLQGSAISLKAKHTKDGIKSAVVFQVPYARGIEEGKRRIGGKTVKLKQKSFHNPKGQFGYASKGAKESEPFFISAIKKVISIAWEKI